MTPPSPARQPSNGVVAPHWPAVARAAFFADLYRGRTVLLVGVGDGAALEVLLDRGAARVLGADDDPRALATAAARLGERIELTPVLPAARFDVVFASDAERLDLDALAARVAPGGFLIAAAANGDQAPGGLGFFALQDQLAARFPAVTMVGQMPFGGAALAPFGDEEAEPRLDAGLLPPPTALVYVAIGGPRRLALGFGLVALPDAAVAAAPASAPALAIERALAAECAERAEAEAATTRALQAGDSARAALAAALQQRDQELERLAREQRAATAEHERRIAELHGAATLHLAEMQDFHALLEERDAFIAELERENRHAAGLRQELERAAGLRQELERAAAQAETAAHHERAARRRIVELEGEVVRLQRSARPAPPPEDPRLPALLAQLAEVEAQRDQSKTRLEEAQREAWAHLKARSEAEANAAEVREDTVRKLRDARKVANIELMRAMDEATRKAVGLKEELTRSEVERKQATSQLQALQPEREALLARLRLVEEQQEATRRTLGELQREAADAAAATGALAELRAELARVAAERERIAGEFAAAVRQHEEQKHDAVQAVALGWDLRAEAETAAARAASELAAAAARLEEARLLREEATVALAAAERSSDAAASGMQQLVDELGRAGEGFASMESTLRAAASALDAE